MQHNMKDGFTKAPVFTGMYGLININNINIADRRHVCICRCAGCKSKCSQLKQQLIIKILCRDNCTVYSYITERNGKIIAQSKEQPLAVAMNGKGTH